MIRLFLVVTICLLQSQTQAQIQTRELLLKVPPALERAGLIQSKKMTPEFFIEDFDGDGKTDIVLFVESKKNRKNGLCILHADSPDCVLIGAGTKFASRWDNFRWADKWALVPPGETWETRFDANGEVANDVLKVILLNRGIRLCASESGCGIVTFRRGQYIWVHQSD